MSRPLLPWNPARGPPSLIDTEEVTSSILVSPTSKTAGQGPREEILHGPRATIGQQAVDVDAPLDAELSSEKILLRDRSTLDGHV